MPKAMLAGVGGWGSGVGKATVDTAAQERLTSFKELRVWQKSFELAVQVYELTKAFPQSELYGMTSQMRRAAYSIPTNIAEGYRRSHQEYIRFLYIAYGSASELETFLLMTERLQYGNPELREVCMHELQDVLRMLNGLTSKLRA